MLCTLHFAWSVIKFYRKCLEVLEVASMILRIVCTYLVYIAVWSAEGGVEVEQWSSAPPSCRLMDASGEVEEDSATQAKTQQRRGKNF